MEPFQIIGKSEEKIDSLSLATGNSRFADDFHLDNPLYLACLYSPHAHAEIIDIDDRAVKELPGVVDVFHYKNVKQILHSTAGQGYPEPSPYDTVLFDDKVRFVGDRVAMVAAESPEAAAEAVKLIKVDYKILHPLLDPEKAMEDDAPVIHRSNCFAPIGATYEPERNLAAEIDVGFGDVANGEQAADFVIERSYTNHYGSHGAMEPHAALSFFDEMGRLVIISTTQVPFHARRIVSQVLEYPLAKIRVIKPRIGGGFGGKQEVILEPLVALATIKHHRPAKLVFSREEVFRSSRTQHSVRIKLKTAVKNNGQITALDMDALLNSGAYGTHAFTVLSNVGSKVLPMLNKIENVHFLGRSVYTNLPIGGAYRGYGATQGYFALNQQLDIITRKLNRDFLEFIKANHIQEGETSKVFEILGEGTDGVPQQIHSCKLDECIDIGAREIDWYNKRDKRIRNGKKVRGVGAAVSMQGSGIPLVDMAAASMKMNEDGSFNLDIGATDLGTGSDTVLAQIAAEVLGVGLDRIIVLSSDTDRTPFDVGAYASSTTYVSGGAVKKCAEKIKDQILGVAAKLMDCDKAELNLRKGMVVDDKSQNHLSLADVATHSLYSEDQFQIQADASHIVHESPPPFSAQFAEVEVDSQTGEVRVLRFVSAVDCGQAINPKLAEGQVEGATLNAISYALTEEYRFSSRGSLLTRSFNDYRCFTAADLPEMKTVLVGSYEKTGPYGAKSVGEVGTNGPLPAIANAIYDAVGVRLYEAPFTADKIYRAMKNKATIDS